MISLRLAMPADLDFLIECFNKSHEINDYAHPVSNIVGWNAFKAHLFGKLCEQDIIIVHRNNKDIGFFIQELDDVNMHLGGATFIHPHACKMSVITLGQAAAMRGIAYGLANDFKYIEFNVWHPLLLQNVKRIMPNLKEFILHKEYIILFLDFASLDKEHYEKCVKAYGIRDWDANFCFEADNI